MKPRYAKVSEIAERFRVSVDAVYLWIREGKIPAECVIRIAGTVRVDEEQFELRLRAGALYHSRGRRHNRAPNRGPAKDQRGS
jgi:excisionase family DNA binding protein